MAPASYGHTSKEPSCRAPPRRALQPRAGRESKTRAPQPFRTVPFSPFRTHPGGSTEGPKTWSPAAINHTPPRAQRQAHGLQDRRHPPSEGCPVTAPRAARLTDQLTSRGSGWSSHRPRLGTASSSDGHSLKLPPPASPGTRAHAFVGEVKGVAPARERPPTPSPHSQAPSCRSAWPRRPGARFPSHPL